MDPGILSTAPSIVGRNEPDNARMRLLGTDRSGYFRRTHGVAGNCEPPHGKGEGTSPQPSPVTCDFLLVSRLRLPTP